MKSQLKLGLYVVTAVGTLLFGSLFLQSWRRSNEPAVVAGQTGKVAKPREASSNRVAKADTRGKKTPAAKPSTNASATQGTAGVTGSDTNETSSAEETSAATNAVAVPDEPSATNAVAAVSEGESNPENEAVPMHMANVPKAGFGRMITYGLLAVVALVGLGVLVAYDVSHYTAHRASQVLFDDRGPDADDTEYEKIEKVYGSGEYLETVRLLREFLVKNPRAVHAQLRIAEIYEKDLHNPLASALEYEEVLKLPLEPTRRGWTAIHLVNLYNRLDRTAQAVALMQQICVDCPETPAAAKARERLEAMGEPVPQAPLPSAGGDAGGGAGGLPPGFRKKR